MEKKNSEITPELLDAARSTLLSSTEPSISFLQRRLHLPYSTALEIMNKLEGDIISPPDQAGRRKILNREKGN